MSASHVPTGTELRKPRGSVWEEKILSGLRAHIEAESEILSDYSRFGEQSEAPDVAYLVRLIADDEARHHRVLTELANAIRSDIDFGVHEPAVPRLSQKALPGLEEQTSRFIRMEKDDARTLKRLSRELRSVRDTSLWALLIELMELDTAKHLRILRFIERRVGHVA